MFWAYGNLKNTAAERVALDAGQDGQLSYPLGVVTQTAVVVSVIFVFTLLTAV